MADDSSESTPTNSISTFGVSVVINGVILLVSIIGFLILRPLQSRIYQPRSTIDTVPANERPRPLKSGVFAWLQDLLTRKESDILQDAGLDGYFFLRYLRFNVLISFVGVIVLFPILLSVNGTGGNGQHGFDLLSFTNVKNPKRFYAHVFLGWMFNGFIIFSLYREFVYYIGVRQAVLTSPAYSNLISSRTVLIQTLPNEYLDEAKLKHLFDGVKFISISRVQKTLVEKVNERNALAMKVEAAETKLLKTAIKNRLKAEKKALKNSTAPAPMSGSDINDYVPEKKRPTHKLKFLIGKKVDTIEYGKEHIPELNGEIKYLQERHNDANPLNSVFITFHTQEQAEVAVQVLAHHRALHMSPRYIGITPNDVIWMNLRMFWWERLVRHWGAMAFIIALIIFWSIPVAFVGLVSNVKYLMQKISWLEWLGNIPSWIFGAISGFLPSVLLAVLMALLPIILRLMAKISGVPSGSLVERYVQGAYFGFQVVQVFLVTTLASGATSVVTQIVEDPTSAMSLLASNLPKSSNFYIAYFLLQGFSIAGTSLLQIVALLLFHVLGTLLDSTPRKKWSRWNILGTTGWGTVFPVYTNLAVIAITYAIISPILLGFSGVAFLLLYLAYLHNLIFTVQPSDGRGIYYPRALSQTFTGLYLGEVCLLGLFVVAKSWGPLVLEAILIGVTAFAHITFNQAFEPLLFSLPRNLLKDLSTKNLITSETQPLIGKDGAVELQEIHTDSPEKHTHNASLDDTVPLSTETHLEEGIPESTALEKLGPIGQYLKPHVYLTPFLLQKNFLGPRFKESPSLLSNEEESLAYAHPAASATNPIVWIPKDPYGLSEIEVSNLKQNDIDATTEGTWFEIDENKKKIKQFKWGPIEQIPIWEKPKQY
ncbi:uncharacterized protein SAPINGB_P006476 [Magnusiomyces paraingens]|uniref:DUF221-domain-containing protein n=1 Tax=Magnusiomyces paraingens TaxID=2606893 RepID=A0A5E8CA61_9ASCO|nr:uncharacterized protein SAPINGB_P006476 [Saprochaete ingens]VVT58971.1 unnamed protein product [Saprochaete ingens]